MTICVNDRRCLFGPVTDDAVRLNDAGVMIVDAWTIITRQFAAVDFDDAVVPLPRTFSGVILTKEAPVLKVKRVTEVGATFPAWRASR